jgi:hypothetical protein
MAANVRKQFDAVLASNQHATVIFVRQAAPVSGLWDALLVPDITRKLLKNACLLALKAGLVKIGIDSKLGTSGRQVRHPTNVGHDSLCTDKKARTDITVLA